MKSATISVYNVMKLATVAVYNFMKLAFSCHAVQGESECVSAARNIYSLFCKSRFLGRIFSAFSPFTERSS